MARNSMSITDLPVDILVIIFPYLDARSFLALCSTCKAFQQPSIRLDPAYWSYVTRSTFRIPNQPVVQHDGVRWQKMYRRLFTQSRVFTWGQNTHNRLGHRPPYNPSGPRIMRPRRNNNVALPTEMDDTRTLGVIADMQCGGWSTTLLTSDGVLHTTGVLNGMKTLATRERLHTLQFPHESASALVGTQEENQLEAHSETPVETRAEDPKFAVRQFSAGRAHILALSDSGRIWSWYESNQPALQVKFAKLDTKEASLYSNPTASTFGQVKQVVAGWSRSSAFVYGIGIIVWDPVEREDDKDGTDSMLVLEHGEVPKTGYQRIHGHRESDEEKALSEEVGAVRNYIMLENYVVFVTDIGRAFYGQFGENSSVEDICELRHLRSINGSPIDVQGSFRRFAIFKDDEVITTDQDYLDACWTTRHNNPEQENIEGLRRIPALQHNDVISVAFGDYHFLALHSDGRITSYGTEMQACGALGLGYHASSLARGLRYDANDNGCLAPHVYTHGRQVWFDIRKNDWIKDVVHGHKDDEESEERRVLFLTDLDVNGQVSDWFEQEAQAWDEDGGEDGLGAYFALRVSAAGWHSGALVLVNEELEAKEVGYNWKDQNFPRLKLANGREMPGSGPFDEWRKGRPDWQLNDNAAV